MKRLKLTGMDYYDDLDEKKGLILTYIFIFLIKNHS